MYDDGNADHVYVEPSKRLAVGRIKLLLDYFDCEHISIFKDSPHGVQTTIEPEQKQ
jgi:hypothetical protein